MKTSPFAILEEFCMPAEATENAADVRRILARLVDAGAVSIGELQSARDIVCRTPGADARTYLPIAALFVALHSGKASLALTGDVQTDASILVKAGRIDRRTEELADDADEISRLIMRLWPAEGLADSPFIANCASPGVPAAQLYFRRYHTASVRVHDLLAARMSAGAADGASSAKPPETALTYSLGNFVLSAEQRRAVEAAVANRLAVITGGPGTGKTTIVCSMLRALVATENLTAGEIALAAPTGRAAQRMGEALRKQCLAAADAELPPGIRAMLTSLSGMTIHSLLGGRAPHWRHGPGEPLPHRLVIIDEASMVDLLLMRALLDALRPDCRLVLLGDANQLPPVEAGAVLGELVENFGGKVVRLTESRRFTGSLKTCAEEFNSGELNTLAAPSSRFPDDLAGAVRSPDTLNACLWREPRDPAGEVDAFLREWADAHGLGKDGLVTRLAAEIKPADAAFAGEMTSEAKALFDALDASRILTVVRNGPFGAVRANDNLLRNRIGRAMPPASAAHPHRLSVPGIPVIVTVNSPALGLFNGDVGVTVAGDAGMYALFPRGEKVVACPASLLPEHDLAYAITVHKSQGSEFGDALVVLPDTPGHPLLTRRMVYTAITRARLRAVIFASAQALQAAVK